MKLKIILVFLLVASTKGQSQNTELVDYFLQLHKITESYYDSMMMTFRDARRALSEHLNTLNSAGVLEVTEGLRIIIAIRNETQAWIDLAIGEGECLENAVFVWQQGIAGSGSSLSSCANENFTPVINATDDFLALIDEQSRQAFEVQNLILNALSEVNLMTNESDITPFVSDQVDQTYTNFNYNIIPSIIKQLQVFRNFEETVPYDIHGCVSAVVSRLNDEALVLRNTLEFC